MEKNAVKAQVLGMPFGTANSRLKKKIIYYLADKLNMLECYRCHQRIDNLDEFSIEHTESWLYSENPIETYFDVERIAFSHRVCNSAAGIRLNKIESPEGMSWCWRCQTNKPLEEFTKGSRNGVAKNCSECNTALKADYRQRTGKR